MNDLAVGDAVQLKAGGCLMTVDAVDGEAVRCVWFNDSQELCRDVFELTALRKVTIQHG